MKCKTTLAVVLGLSLSATSAFAKEATGQDHAASQVTPAAMTDEQLDGVSAGLLDGINVILVDVVDVNNNDVAVQVNLPVSAAVAAFGSDAGSAVNNMPGRILQ